MSTEKKPKNDLEKVNYWKEFILTFSNKKSLFSSKKIERAIVFNVFLVITVIYVIKNIHELEPLDLVEITGLWLVYGGYNSVMNYRDRKMEKETSDPDSESNPE
jgi:hypothetical protein